MKKKDIEIMMNEISHTFDMVINYTLVTMLAVVGSYGIYQFLNV